MKDLLRLHVAHAWTKCFLVKILKNVRYSKGIFGQNWSFVWQRFVHIEYSSIKRFKITRNMVWNSLKEQIDVQNNPTEVPSSLKGNTSLQPAIERRKKQNLL